MTSLGERLRRQRLQDRVSLEKVSLETKIGVRLLEAIEAEQFEKLPGGVFRRSFVLQYARALGVDPEEIAGELAQLNQFDDAPAMPTADMIRSREPASESGSRFTFPLASSTIGSLLAAVGVTMVCALFYSWWQTPPAHKQEIARVQAPAAVSAPPLPAPVEASPVVAAPEAAQSNPEGALVRVGFSADEKTWISVSSDGKKVFASSLQPNETKVVEASEKVRLYTGNAGGLEISLNGKPIGPIGPRGQVRIVEFTQAGFHIVPRRPPTLEPL